jgi:rare lipoprotein A
MSGLKTHTVRPRFAPAMLAILATIAPTSAGQAQQSAEPTRAAAAGSAFAAAFADIGPATTAPIAQGHAVDVTEIAPAPAAEAPARLISTGRASYYSNEFAGSRTASGEAFDPQELTAAHRTLPFGSRVRVTNQNNGRSVVVRINDRGPFSRGRLIDVSHAAAEHIGMIRSGHAEVSLELVED